MILPNQLPHFFRDEPNNFTTDVSIHGLRVISVKVEVPPTLKNITFDNEIEL